MIYPEELCVVDDPTGLRSAFLRCGFLVDAAGVVPLVDAVLTVADYANFGLVDNDLFALCSSFTGEECVQQEVLAMCRLLIAGVPLGIVRLLCHHETFRANQKLWTVALNICARIEDWPVFWGVANRPFCVNSVARLAAVVVRHNKVWFAYPHAAAEVAIWAYQCCLNERGLKAWLGTDVISPFAIFYPSPKQPSWPVNPSLLVRTSSDLVKEKSMEQWAVWGSEALLAGLSYSEAVSCYYRSDRPSVSQLRMLAGLQVR